MPGEYRVDYRLTDQQEVVYRLFPLTIESTCSQPGKATNIKTDQQLQQQNSNDRGLTSTFMSTDITNLHKSVLTPWL